MTSDIAGQLGNTFQFKSIGSLASNLWGVAFAIGALAALGFLVLGGITWITGGGEKAKVEEARERITQGMVGLGILAVSWAVALLAQRFLGLSIFGGGGGGGKPNQYPCTSSDVSVPPGQCRNQDCQFYVCNGKYWIPQGKYEDKCKADPKNGCYGVNPNF